ncbi:MAG: SDR family NAD(P)-dependent oxidoreductase [Limisphaerales bacterium]
MNLEGKHILVVGGTSGLGASAARAFLDQGAKVVVSGRNQRKLEDASNWLGQQGIAVCADASCAKAMERLLAKACEFLGRLDALYHVAGGSGRRFGDGPLHTIPDEGWQQTLRLNLDSVFYSNRAAINCFLDQGQGGAILNCGSVLGHAPSSRFFTTHAYAASKAALEGLTRSMASFYASQSIRVNLLCPALVATPMSARAQEDPAILSYIASKQPLDGGRIGLPEDLDAAATFLLSDAARFVTGQVLNVDGGWSVSEGNP